MHAQEHCVAKVPGAIVRELAKRSMTAAKLLEFCCTTLRDKMDKFDAKKTTTNDVVRSVIIPVTRPDNDASPVSSSYAAVHGEKAFPMKMVTHNWNNLFADLIAAVVADALGEDSYGRIAEKLASRDGTE